MIKIPFGLMVQQVIKKLYFNIYLFYFLKGIDSIPVIPLLTRDEVSELYLICYGSGFLKII